MIMDHVVDGGAMSTIHPDILQTHILTRLDGPSLAAASCVSTDLRALSAQDKLWEDVCSSKWPSVNHPLVSEVISMLPSGHRAFFSDAYPLLYHDDHHPAGQPHNSNILPAAKTTRLISAVDIYYKDIPIFSRVVETETETGWFLCCPFRVDIDLIEQKQYVQPWAQQAVPPAEKDSWLHELEENLTLSWILIDPKRKRAVNMSSMKPVSVQRHWLTGEVRAKFATIMAGDGVRGSEREYVKCEIALSCEVKEESGKVEVREVYMAMEDMQGRSLNGKNSLAILQEAMERGERRKGREGKEGKQRLDEFLERTRLLKERRQKKEKVLDIVSFATGITVFVSFWSFILFK